MDAEKAFRKRQSKKDARTIKQWDQGAGEGFKRRGGSEWHSVALN
jgi:hypothetical protein